MASVKIDELLLDTKNPRHAPAKSQKETMTRVLEEQKDKLVKLAESVIAQKGLSPLENILVLDKKPGDTGYVVLEGNRRVAVLKVLNNPSLISPKALTAFTAADFATAPKPAPPKPTPPKPGPPPPKRTGIVPPGHAYNVSSPRISKIQQELVTLKYTQHINAIAVLFRVFVETSTDHYLGKIGSSTKKANGKFKSLAEKITEACDHLISLGADKKIFNPLKAALHSPSSPLWIDLMHSYVHSAAGSPTSPVLEAAWDHASPLLTEIWK